MAIYGHTNGMKTAASIPDDIFHAAEELALRGRKSRSKILSDALQEYVARHSPDTVTEAMNRVCEQVACEDYDIATVVCVLLKSNLRRPFHKPWIGTLTLSIGNP